MNRIYHFIGALDARNLLILAAAFLFFASCAKSEIAQNDAIAPSSEAAVPGEGDEAGPDAPENPDEPDDPSQDGPSIHASDWISPDHFNMVQMELAACADIENNPSATKLFGLESAFVREEPLDEEGTRTHLGDVVNNKQLIYWDQDDKIKIYYYSGSSNYTEGTIKHGGSADSTIDGWVNEDDDYYYAFYPYNDDPAGGIVTAVTYDGDATYPYGAFTVTVPAEQDGQFENCHLAVGKASKTGRNFAFSNVGSYMKITVSNTTATGITLQATNASDNIVGQFVVPFTDEAGTVGTPVFVEDTGASSVTVSLPEERTGPVTVYVALLPNVTFSKGFRLRYEYDDDTRMPGFAYVKRDGRSISRRKILNISTLDDRIRTDYFVRTDGSYSDADASGAGASWDAALNVNGLADLIMQPLSGTSQDDMAAYDRAVMLDGANIHIAAGEYCLYDAGADQSTTAYAALKMEYTGYDRQVRVRFYGAYPSSATGTSTAVRDTALYVTAFVGGTDKGILALGNQTDVRLDGLTFKDCAVDASSTGALKIASGLTGTASLQATSCTFANNANSSTYTGAACLFHSGTIAMEKCTFTGNFARNGSALNIYSDAAPTVSLSRCKFSGNRTFNTSGALQNEGGTLTVSDCLFDSNSCAVSDTTVFGAGGAFHANGAGSVTTFTRCLFTGNSAKFGGVLSLQQARVTCTDCIFTDNSAWRNQGTGKTDPTGKGAGGVAYLYDSSSYLTLEGCTLSGNSAPYASAGAIYVGNGASLTLDAGTAFTGNFCYIQGGAINCDGILTANGTSASPVSFIHNYTTQPTQAAGNGGGLRVAGTGSAALSYVSFTGNVAGSGSANKYSNGGGLQVDGATAFSASHCTFSGNLARNGGGFHALSGSATYTLSDCTFSSNWCNEENDYFDATISSCNFHGAAACVTGSTVVFTDCTFYDNRAYNGSGALHINNASSDVTCSGCTFSSNSALTSSAWGGAVIVEAGSFTATGGTSFASNAAYSGGAIAHAAGTTLSLSDCTFSSNTATNKGGAVYSEETSALTFTNCGFSGNSATASEGGDAICAPSATSLTLTGSSLSSNYVTGHTTTVPIHSPSVTAYTFEYLNFKNNTSSRNGCLMNLDNSANRTFAISNCNIEGNSAPNGGAIYANLKRVSSITAGKGDCTISNTTIKDNTATADESLGGAIYWNCASWSNSLGSPKLYISDGSALEGNQAGKAGSAIYLNIGRVCLDQSSVKNNTFASYVTDADGRGGTLYMGSSYSKYDITNCELSGNAADGRGGVVYVNGGRVFMTNCICNDNTTYSRGGVFCQQGSGFVLARRCSFVGNRVTASSGWGNFIHVYGGSTQYSMLLNCTVDEGSSLLSRACINGTVNLLMTHCTLIANSSGDAGKAIRVENGRNGLLLNNIILNRGGGDAIFHSGSYNWSSYGGYNILGTVNQNGQTVSNIPGGRTGDQTGKTEANLGYWLWNEAGYYSWDGTVGGTATATPAIDNAGYTDYVSLGLASGFNYNFTASDSYDFSVTTSNLGNNLMTVWGASEYYRDQRGETTADRRIAGNNFPGAYAPLSPSYNAGGGGTYSGSDINTNSYEY